MAITDVSGNTVRELPFLLLATTSARSIELDPKRVYTFANLGIDGTANFGTASTGVVSISCSRTSTAPTTPVLTAADDVADLLVLQVGKAYAIGPHIQKVTVDATASVLVQVVPTEWIDEQS